MPNYLNAFSCLASVSNTGFTSCHYTPGLIEAVLLVPRGHEFSTADISDMLTTVQDGLAEDVQADRFQLIKTFVGMEDKSSEGVYEATPYGGNRKIRNGKYSYTFEYIKGGACLHQKISSLDNKQDLFDVIYVDTQNNVLLGVKTTDNKFKGFTLEMIDVPNFKLNTGAADSKFYVTFAMQNPDEFNNSWGIVSFDKSVNLLYELNSLIDTEIVVHTAMTAGGLVKLQINDGCGATNLADTYSTELATASLYTAQNVATGNAITVTSVTYAAATKTFNVQLDSADPDYPSTAGSLIKITIGDVSDLITAGVLGHAGASITTPRS